MVIMKMDVVVVLVYLNVKIVKVMLLTVPFVTKKEFKILHLVLVMMDIMNPMVNVYHVLIDVKNVLIKLITVVLVPITV